MSNRRHADAAVDFPMRRDRAPSGRPLCRVCGGEVPKGRLTVCGKACEATIRIACWPAEQRRAVWRRDRGICAKCGMDTERLKRILRHAGRDARSARAAMGFNSTGRSLWEADHIVPVVEGGGVAVQNVTADSMLANLRTLCTPCHRQETAALAKRRAEKRRAPLFVGHEVQP